MKKLIQGKKVIDLGSEKKAPQIDERLKKNLDSAVNKNYKSAIRVLVDWIKSDQQEDPFKDYREF